MEPQALVIGRTYYQLTFADRDSTMPGVEPLVFLGEVSLDDGRRGFALQDTVSYVRFGSRLEMTEDNDEVMLYLMSGEEVRAIVDIAEVAREVVAAAARAASLNHPVLKGAPHRMAGGALVQLEESRLRRFLRDSTRFPPARGATFAGDAGENVVRTGLGYVDCRRPAPYSPPTRSGRYRSAGRAVPT